MGNGPRGEKGCSLKSPIFPIFACVMIFISLSILIFQRSSCDAGSGQTNEGPPPAAPYESENPNELPFGVNVWGAGLNQTYGLVEATIGVIRSLEAAGIPYVINDVDEFERKPKVGEPPVFTSPPKAPYFFNLWSMVFTRALKNSKNYGNYFYDRYNLALWYWELEIAPREAAPAYPIYDQVWTASDYVANAFLSSPERSHVPVRRQCVALLLENMQNLTDEELMSLKAKHRPRFGLDPNDFVYFFNWDYESLGERKNPMAVLDAFKLAFDNDSNSRVSLFLKTKAPRALSYKEMHKQLVAKIGNDSRVHLMTDVISSEDMEILYKTADAYVSLHRSEGFGNGIAYSMVLGKPVIATNYSANAEYMSEDNSYPVQWNYTTITKKLYIFPAGARWANADVAHAAERMKEVLNNPTLAREKGVRARDNILSRYSPKVCGKTIRDELEFMYTHRNIINRYLVARYKKT